MNEQDKAFARTALEEKALTIEQVQEIRAEVDRSGRSFEDCARARGYLRPATAVPSTPPPAPPRPAPVLARAPVSAPAPAVKKPIPTLYVVLLGCTLLIVLGVPVTILRLVERSRKDDDLALETERSRVEAERQASDASRNYKRAVVSGNEAVAREHLLKARDAMGRVEKMLLSGRLPPELPAALNEAFVGYNMYLKEIPDDVEVRIERARTHELRRNYDLAVADLERVVDLRRDLEPTLRERITKLRALVARKPQ